MFTQDINVKHENKSYSVIFEYNLERDEDDSKIIYAIDLDILSAIDHRTHIKTEDEKIIKDLTEEAKNWAEANAEATLNDVYDSILEEAIEMIEGAV